MGGRTPPSLFFPARAPAGRCRLARRDALRSLPTALSPESSMLRKLISASRVQNSSGPRLTGGCPTAPRRQPSGEGVTGARGVPARPTDGGRGGSAEQTRAAAPVTPELAGSNRISREPP